MSNLIPGTWIECKLGDVVAIVRGVTFPASSKVHEPTDGYVACLRTSHIQEKLLWNNIYYIPSNYVKGTDRLAKRNDILMSMANSSNLVGKVCIKETDREACFGAFLSAIRSEGASHAYIYYFLKSSKAQQSLRSSASQTVNIANISVAALEQLPLPLAPLPEQTRIAAKLDELLAQVDTLKARIDGIPALLKRFRQSVLAAAVSGRLTRESYDSLSGTYALEPLGKLVAEPLRNGKSVKDGIGQRVLRLSALKKNSIDFFESKAGNWTGINFEQYIVKNDDFLISRGNGSKALVGRGGLARHVTDNVAYPDTMIRVRPDTQKLLPKFLATVWNSQLVRGQIESTARTTAGIWKISQGDLEVLKIPLPSLVEQSEIVCSVEQLFAYADQLETKIASAKSRIDHLTQSILIKAFRGELVPQDPNDETAGTLLDRIKAQRATAPKAKRGRQAAMLG
jgi:type I restriction enzyme S subunit